MPWSSHLHRKLRLLAIGALVISALAVSPALAKGRPPQPTGGAQCWVSPNPVAFGTPFTVWGSGYTPGSLLDVYLVDQAGTTGLLAGVTSSGWFQVMSIAAYTPPVTLDVYVYNAMDRKMTLLCHTTFSVQ